VAFRDASPVAAARVAAAAAARSHSMVSVASMAASVQFAAQTASHRASGGPFPPRRFRTTARSLPSTAPAPLALERREAAGPARGSPSSSAALEWVSCRPHRGGCGSGPVLGWPCMHSETIALEAVARVAALLLLPLHSMVAVASMAASVHSMGRATSSHIRRALPTSRFRTTARSLPSTAPAPPALERREAAGAPSWVAKALCAHLRNSSCR